MSVARASWRSICEEYARHERREVGVLRPGRAHASERASRPPRWRPSAKLCARPDSATPICAFIPTVPSPVGRVLCGQWSGRCHCRKDLRLQQVAEVQDRRLVRQRTAQAQTSAHRLHLVEQSSMPGSLSCRTAAHNEPEHHPKRIGAAATASLRIERLDPILQLLPGNHIFSRKISRRVRRFFESYSSSAKVIEAPWPAHSSPVVSYHETTPVSELP